MHTAAHLNSHSCRSFLAVFHWQATIMGPVSISSWFALHGSLHNDVITYVYVSFLSSVYRTTVLIRVACSSWPSTSPQITHLNRQRSVSFYFLSLCQMLVWHQELLNINSMMPGWGNVSVYPHSNDLLYKSNKWTLCFFFFLRLSVSGETHVCFTLDSLI